MIKQNLQMARTSVSADPETAPTPAAKPSPEALKTAAGALINDPGFRAAVDKTRTEIVRQWRATDIEESERREHFWAQMRALEELEKNLDKIKLNGK